MHINRTIKVTLVLSAVLTGASISVFSADAKPPNNNGARQAAQAAQRQQRQMMAQERRQQQQQMQQQRREQQQQMAQQRRQEFRQQHPARAEVLGRDNHLNNMINQDRGDLNGHYNQLKSEDASIRRQEQRDAAMNGGHLTRGEYNQLNREENGLGRQISRDNYGAGNAQFQQNHPWRSEVLGRDANLNNQINQDRGDLNGHYGQLKSEDRSIQLQEQRDAAMNGGHLTRGEYNQLNREENGLSRQISRDNYGAGNAAFQAAHPRRSQVLGQDASLNNQINADKGHLSGQYGQLKREDRSIQVQDRKDAARNGGYLTQQQQQHLDNEETALQNQINMDNK